MFPFLKKKPLKLQNTIILVVCFSTFVSLIVSAILIRNSFDEPIECVR